MDHTMTDTSNAPLIDDGYVAYYTEKLWAMIPAVYRHEDGIAINPGVLRALVTTWARQAAALRRSQDRTWEDFFIELCSGWAIPYIGDLVGTRLLSAYNLRGQRIDVAKTIYYRRRAGTLRVLEELIADITGWEGVVVEGFKTLLRTFHNLDLSPVPRGRLTLTPPGGTPDLRRADAANLVGTPFDEYFYTPDVRRTKSYGIPKLLFHLYRLGAVELPGVDPLPHAAPTGTAFTFDPSGRDVPLFAPRTRPEQWEAWRSAKEYELPKPIPCRLMSDAQYQVNLEDADTLITAVGLTAGAAADVQTVAEIRFRSEGAVRTRLAMLPNAAELLSPGVYPHILRLAELPECGKFALLPNAASIRLDGSPDPLPNHEVAAANLSVWEAFPLHKRALIDPERGRLIVYDPAPSSILVNYHVGVYQPVGAGGFARRFSASPDNTFSGGGALAAIPPTGVVRLEDSRTYTPVADVANISGLIFAAADQQRPYLRLDADCTFTSTPPDPAQPDPVMTLEGLWIGAVGEARAVILAGDYEQVTIRYCTFDPGGLDTDGNEIPPVALVIAGYVERLVIDACIMGTIRLDGTGAVETLVMRDSIVQATRASDAALLIGAGMVDMARVTVLGGVVDILRLYATDCLIAGMVDVTDTQEGCFRFSAAPPGSRLPRPYESCPLDAGMVKALFVSDEYGQPGYAMLQQSAPEAVARGGEGGVEMGVYNRVRAPFKLDGLRAKVTEFMPFGLLPIFVVET
jgi:hypothetical protein